MTQVVCNTHNAEGTGLPVTSYVKSLVICRHLSGSHEREPANDSERVVSVLQDERSTEGVRAASDSASVEIT